MPSTPFVPKSAEFHHLPKVMTPIISQLAECIESGKISRTAPYPPRMNGQPGADELCAEALAGGIRPEDILNEALIPAMSRIGDRFGQGKAFIPEMLMAAKAMNVAMAHLKPYFSSGAIRKRGVFVVGTVAGDLHDIGKKLAAMMIEGAGWEVVDLGVDVGAAKFLEAVRSHPGCVVGLSALLTTTMKNMGPIVAEIRAEFPGQRILVGGAPLSEEFCRSIGATMYAADGQQAVGFLQTIEAGIQ
jgi:methanogenic corrinoid protein MtbC1